MEIFCIMYPFVRLIERKFIDFKECEFHLKKLEIIIEYGAWTGVDKARKAKY